MRSETRAELVSEGCTSTDFTGQGTPFENIIVAVVA